MNKQTEEPFRVFLCVLAGDQTYLDDLHRMHEVAAHLMNEGYAVFMPTINDPITWAVPDNQIQHSELSFLRACDCVVVLNCVDDETGERIKNGWSDLCVNEADKAGIPVVFDRPALFSDIERKKNEKQARPTGRPRNIIGVWEWNDEWRYIVTDQPSPDAWHIGGHKLEVTDGIPHDLLNEGATQ